MDKPGSRWGDLEQMMCVGVVLWAHLVRMAVPLSPRLAHSWNEGCPGKTMTSGKRRHSWSTFWRCQWLKAVCRGQQVVPCRGSGWHVLLSTAGGCHGQTLLPDVGLQCQIGKTSPLTEFSLQHRQLLRIFSCLRISRKPSSLDRLPMKLEEKSNVPRKKATEISNYRNTDSGLLESFSISFLLILTVPRILIFCLVPGTVSGVRGPVVNSIQSCRRDRQVKITST